MSDSDDDFASADEGDLDASHDDKGKKPAKGPEVKPQDTDTKQPSKINEKSAKSKGGGKFAAAKDGKSDRQNKSTDGDKCDVAEQAADSTRPQRGKGKQGKQKGGKGKKTDSKPESAPTDNKQIISKQNTKKEPTSETIKESETDESIVEGSQATSSSETITKPQVVQRKDNTPEQTKDSKAGSPPTETKIQEAEKDTECQSAPSKAAVKDAAKTLAKDKPKSKEEAGDMLSVEEKANMLKSPSSQSISRPEPDHTEKQEEVLDRLASSAQEKKGGWGWGWGSSLLEVASTSVSTFSHQVGEGFHTVMETVESTLNIPDPEELALRKTADKECKQDMEEIQVEDTEGGSPEADIDSKELKQSDADGNQSNQAVGKSETQSKGGWFSGWGVSSITKTLENTSKHLVTGSLDVLESLGKKTFDVINEHDPGLKRARAFLHDRGDKPNLSALLRDAKEQQEFRVKQEQESEEARKCHFGSLFDDFQGLAHLEALEMLSNQSEKRVNSLLHALSPEALSKLKPQLLQIKENFEIDDDEDEDVSEQEFELLVTELLNQLNIGVAANKIVKTHSAITGKLEQYENDTETDIKDIHQVAISSLAEFTSKCIEQFHKVGELILTQKSPIPNFKECSTTLHRFTKVLTAEVGILSTKFSDSLNKHEGDGEIKINHLVTNIYLEASNSSSYIQDGFRLLLPVLQQASIESSQEPES